MSGQGSSTVLFKGEKYLFDTQDVPLGDLKLELKVDPEDRKHRLTLKSDGLFLVYDKDAEDVLDPAFLTNNKYRLKFNGYELPKDLLCFSLDRGSPWAYTININETLAGNVWRRGGISEDDLRMDVSVEKLGDELNPINADANCDDYRKIYDSEKLKVYRLTREHGLQRRRANVFLPETVMISDGSSSIADGMGEDKRNSQDILRDSRRTSDHILVAGKRGRFISSKAGVFDMDLSGLGIGEGTLRGITEEEYYDNTGLLPKEYLKRNGMKDYLKRFFKDNPQGRLIAVSAPLTIASIATIYASPNFTDYVLATELINASLFLASPKLIEMAFKVKWLDKDSDGAPYTGRIKDLAGRMGVHVDRIGVSDYNIPNAFTYFSLPNRNNLVFTKRVLEKLSDDELMGVTAHELQHMKGRDSLVMYGLSSALMPLAALKAWIFFKMFSWTNFLAVAFASGTANYVMSKVSKNNEYRADRASADYVGKDYIVSALEKIIPKRLRKYSSSSHPSFYDRKEALNTGG